MEFPFGHNHHHSHHQHRRDDDSDEPRPFPPPPQPLFGGPHSYPPPPPDPFSGPHSYPPAPPPSFGGPHSYPPPPDPFAPPPPPGVYYSSHTPSYDSGNYPPPPPPPHVVDDDEPRHHFKPHFPSFPHRHESQHNTENAYGYDGPSDLGELAHKPTYRIYCKASGDRFAVAVRDGKLILTYPDPSDPTQHWFKDEKYSTKVKDSEGNPSFALVNRATVQALKHPVAGHPVQLVHYKPDHLDASILWTESKDLGSGFRTIRTVNNTKLVLDAFHGDKDHGGVHDGTHIALYESWKGDNQNQQWKLVPY